MSRRRKYGAVTVTLPDWSSPGSVMQWLIRDGAKTVRSSAQAYLALAKKSAPHRTGALAEGIIVRPEFEHTSGAKIVAEVCMDPGKNDTFVKVSKKGDRYYYPASQEYGFKTRLTSGRYGSIAYVPGKYYMKSSAAEFSGTFETNVSKALDIFLEEETRL